MFNGSSNVIIQGGTFIIAGNIDSASLKELGANILQNSAMGSNTGQGATANQLSYAQEGSAQEYCKPQVDSAPRSNSADNFESSSWQPPVQEHSPYLMPTPSTTSEVNSWQTVGASRGNSKPNVDSHALPLPFPLGMPMEEMGGNIPQSSDMRSNTGQGPSTYQFSYAQEANAQECCKPQVDPVPRSHSADNFNTSIHAFGQAPGRETPEYSTFFMPTPSITSEVKSWETVGASRKSDVDSFAAPSSFPMPSYFSKPEYGAHALPIQFPKRHPTCPPSQSNHSQFGASPTSSRLHFRASTYPYPAPSPPHFPIPQSGSGASYF